MSGYFIADDASNVPHLWRERGDYPVPIIGRDDLRDDPDVWDALVAWAEGGTQR